MYPNEPKMNLRCNHVLFAQVLYRRIKAHTAYLLNPYNTPRRQVHVEDGSFLLMGRDLRPTTVKGLVRGHIK